MWLESKQLGINPLKLEARIITLECLWRRKQLYLRAFVNMDHGAQFLMTYLFLPALKVRPNFATLPFQRISFQDNVKYLRISWVWLVSEQRFRCSFLGDKEERQACTVWVGVENTHSHTPCCQASYTAVSLDSLSSRFLHCAQHSFDSELGYGLGSQTPLPLPSALLSQTHVQDFS